LYIVQVRFLGRQSRNDSTNATKLALGCKLHSLPDVARAYMVSSLQH